MLKILKSGFYTTIQDKGRFGYRHIGVPVSGTMDQRASSLANAMLENQETDAVMEMTMTGPTLEFLSGTFISITGANLSPTLNGSAIETYSVYKIKEGDVLGFGKHIDGLRAYLAVKGGFLTDKILESRAFYKPITAADHLTSGMEVPYEEVLNYEPKISHIITTEIDKIETLLVSKAPEFDILTEEQKEVLFQSSFTIAKENNRMAYQLEESIAPHQHAMLTSATLPGTVQITPGGKLIILMRDGQTTGGYPRVLQLSDEAINLLSQKAFGNKISLKLL